LEQQVFRQKAIYLCVQCFNRWIENPVSVSQSRRREAASVAGLSTPEMGRGRPFAQFASRKTDGERPPQRLP
jgi:hypothetical protein